MVVNSTVENVLATIGAVLWCIQLLPQIWKSWKTKSTSGLSPWLMLTWTVSMGFLATYNITQRLSIPLHVQPELCGRLLACRLIIRRPMQRNPLLSIKGLLCAISWVQCLYYDRGVRKVRCIVLIAAFCCISAAAQTGCIFALRVSISIVS